jgi:hypothetical protein
MHNIKAKGFFYSLNACPQRPRPNLGLSCSAASASGLQCAGGRLLASELAVYSFVIRVSVLR